MARLPPPSSAGRRPSLRAHGSSPGNGGISRIIRKRSRFIGRLRIGRLRTNEQFLLKVEMKWDMPSSCDHFMRCLKPLELEVQPLYQTNPHEKTSEKET